MTIWSNQSSSLYSSGRWGLAEPLGMGWGPGGMLADRAHDATNDLPLLHGSVSGTRGFVKRTLDLTATIAGLMVLLPLLPLLMFAIWLESPGPVLYRQVRVGLHGKTFWMYKFRSMHLDAEQRREALLSRNEATGPLFKIRNDPRVTRIGRIIRKLSIDELPQLLNVLRGEMSLVGPRPPLPREAATFEISQLEKFDVRPGLTGLWQVSGRSNLSFAEMMELDLRYVREWSLTQDLVLLWRTIGAVLGGEGAY